MILGENGGKGEYMKLKDNLYKFGWFKLNTQMTRNNKHDYSHILFSLILTLWLGWAKASAIMVLWEVVDGFKPLWDSLPAKVLQDKIKFTNGLYKYWLMFIENTFYSDGFGVKDILIFDSLGVLLGCVIGGLL
jgi:hypothetical protein